MFVNDIWNRFLLMNGDMADEINYEYTDGLVSKETRYVRTQTSNLMIERKVTVTYTRDGLGLITKKTIKFETTQTPFE